jgi:hypothetical protein
VEAICSSWRNSALELVGQQVEVIVAPTANEAIAAGHADTIPVVMVTVADPIGAPSSDRRPWPDRSAGNGLRVSAPLPCRGEQLVQFASKFPCK